MTRQEKLLALADRIDHDELWRWLLIPPTGSVRFGARTIAEVVAMAVRDEARKADNLTKED